MVQAPEPQDNTSVWTAIGLTLAAAAGWLFKLLGKQPRPDVPKGLSVADFRRITEHVDTRQDARLAEAMRPVREQLDMILDGLSEGRQEASCGREERRDMERRLGRVETLAGILERRVQASGGD